MKTLKLLLVASLALASSLAARAEISAQAWLETYYLNPQPAELPRAFRALSREGYFDRTENIAVAIGFFATVFARSPQDTDVWLQQLRGLPEKHLRLLAGAFWQAGLPAGSELLVVLGRKSPVRAAVENLAGKPSSPVVETPVLSRSSMNLQWGAFLATGDQRYIVNIFDALGAGQPGLDAAARMSLAQNAVAHPRVLEICRAQLDRQPEEIREALRAIVIHATPSVPRS